MFNSLRARLLLWYTAILALVIAVFAITVALLLWQSRVTTVDLLLRSRAEQVAQTVQGTIGGTFDFELPASAEADDTETIAPYYALWNSAGERLDSPNPDVDVPHPQAPGVWTREGRREVAILAPSEVLVLVGRPLDDVRAEIFSLAATIATVGIGALGLSLAGGWWLVGRALKPVDRISQTANAMVGGDFEARIAIDSVETELGQVAGALNNAFDRLNDSIERQRRFTADASHELRTPLATVSTEVQWALNRGRSQDEYRNSLAVCQRAAARMQSVVERLLTLARAEASIEDRRSHVALHEVVRRVTADLAPVARARDITITSQVGPAVVTGDPDRLAEAITNIVANAVHYNVEGGQVTVTLETTNGEAVLRIEDSGIGIGPADLTRVFEPFFRADPARSRDVGGAGLGLAVSRAVIELYDGRIECVSREGHGTTMTVRLPVVPGVAATETEVAGQPAPAPAATPRAIR